MGSQPSHGADLIVLFTLGQLLKFAIPKTWTTQWQQVARIEIKPYSQSRKKKKIKLYSQSGECEWVTEWGRENNRWHFLAD